MTPPALHYSEYQTRLAAYAVVLDRLETKASAPHRQDHVLLALWNEAGRPLWTLPGGGVELDESVEEGVVREVREETGYDVELGRLLGVDTVVVPPDERTAPGGPWFRGVRVVYEAAVVGGRLTAEVDGTTDEARWVPLAEVPNLARVELVDVGLRLRAAAS